MSAAQPAPSGSIAGARTGVARCIGLLPSAARITAEVTGERVPHELLRLVEVLALIGDGATSLSTSNEAITRAYWPGAYPGLDSDDEQTRKRALGAASRQVQRVRERVEEYERTHGFVWVSWVMGYVDDDGDPAPARYTVPILDVLARTYSETKERRSREWRADPQIALEKALRSHLAGLFDDKRKVAERHPDAKDQRAQTADAKAKAGATHLATAARMTLETLGRRIGDGLAPDSALARDAEVRATALHAHAILAERVAGVRRSPRAENRRDERGRAPTDEERLKALAVAVYAELREHPNPEAALTALEQGVSMLIGQRVLAASGRRVGRLCRHADRLRTRHPVAEPDGISGQNHSEPVPQLVQVSETKCEEQGASADEGATNLSRPLTLVPAPAPDDEDEGGGGSGPPDGPDDDDLFDVYDPDPYRPGGPVEREQRWEEPEPDPEPDPEPERRAPDTSTPPRPRPPSVRFEQIPAELKIDEDGEPVRRWVTWRYELRRDKKSGELKWTKVPYTPGAAEDRAKTNDPETWRTYEKAVETLDNIPYDGLGFMLGGGFMGFDLDKIKDPETGEFEAAARAFVERADTYTEVSPSETGVKGIARGTLPPKGRRKGRIEMYDSVRFFTVTGHRLEGTPATVNERTEAFARLHFDVFGAVAPRAPRRARAEGEGATRTATRTEADDVILERVIGGPGGARVAALLKGDAGRYTNRSDADWSLMCSLAKHTSDEAQLDRIYRSCGLRRSKWDERHAADGRTYGELTIENAVAETASERAKGRAARLRQSPSSTVNTKATTEALAPAAVAVERCDECDGWKGDCHHA